MAGASTPGDYTGRSPSGEAQAAVSEPEPYCIKNPACLYRWGKQLNLARRYIEAADLLEGSLMLAPGDWAVETEYAIALAGAGDAASAQNLLQSILEKPDLPENIRGEIKQLLNRETISFEEPRARRHLALVAGHDSNLTGAPHDSVIELTLPGGRVPMILSDIHLPRAGSFFRADLQQDGWLVDAAGAAWKYGLSGSFRTSPEYTPADIAFLSAQIEHKTVEGDYLRVGHQLQTRDGTLIVSQWQLGVGRDYSLTSLPECQSRAGIDLQQRAYPHDRVHDGGYLGAELLLLCRQEALTLRLFGGRDQAQDVIRPGGDQTQWGGRISAKTSLPVGRLTGELDYYRQHDQRGYSVLLESGRQRNLERIVYRMDYSVEHWGQTLFAGIDYLVQTSSLPLFRIRDLVYNMGARFSW